MQSLGELIWSHLGKNEHPLRAKLVALRALVDDKVINESDLEQPISHFEKPHLAAVLLIAEREATESA